jgi:adenylate cyclase
MESAAAGPLYRFNGFVLDLTRGTLSNAKGEELPLRRKSFDLLRFLIENRGRLLDRDTIGQAIWSDVTVTDDSITQCVIDIRRALGDREQRILKTMRRRGYVFDANVAAQENLPVRDKPSIAVLPFANASHNPDEEYFSDGIADDIITELSRSRALFVIARNSSFAYRGRSLDVRQIARELGVGYLLEGSVRRSAGRVRVTAQLIEAETGNHIWAERYDRHSSEIFAVQDEITSEVTAAIVPAVTDAEQRHALRKLPENLGAWEAYQRGLWCFGKAKPADNDQAREFYQRAITLDAMFSPAYAAMAMTYMHEGLAFGLLSLQETVKLTTGWARKAVEIDASDADAHAIMAWTTAIEDPTRQESWDSVSLALAINPNSSWAHAAKGALTLFTDQPSQARDMLSNALRLDPRGPISVLPLSQIAASYYFERNYQEAMAAARRAVSRYPESPLAYKWLAASLGQLGCCDEAREVLQMATELWPRSIALYASSRPPWFRPEDHEHMRDGLRKAGWQG